MNLRKIEIPMSLIGRMCVMALLIGSVRAAVLGADAYQIEGRCEQAQVKGKGSGGDYVAYEFEVKPANDLKTTLSECPADAEAAVRKVMVKDAPTAFASLPTGIQDLQNKELWQSLLLFQESTPEHCAALHNPGQTDGLMILEISIPRRPKGWEAYREKFHTGRISREDASLLGLVQTDNKGHPVKLLGQFPSLSWGGEGAKSQHVDHICDVHHDGYVEVVLMDGRWEAAGYEILSFNKDFSDMKVTEWDRTAPLQ